MAIASLPMYDVPALRAATDQWWRVLAAHFRRAGLSDVPHTLDRDRTCEQHWQSKDLLLSQCCGYDWLFGSARGLTLVGVLSYRQSWARQPGCYCSVIITPADSPARELGALRGSRCVVNSTGSHSGYNALRFVVAPLAGDERFFASVTESRSHRNSLASIALGDADVAAIDCVTYTLLTDTEPELTAKVRVLMSTPEVAGLPLVTRRDCDPATLTALRTGLAAALRDPRHAPVRSTLRWSGFEPCVAKDYRRLAAMRRYAARFGALELR